jgi:hypothetical protein
MRRSWLPAVVLVSVAACGGHAVTAPTSTPANAPVDVPSVPVAALTTIAESSAIEAEGAGQTGTSNNYLGQSITIPGAVSYNNLRFNWDGYASSTVTAPPIRGPLAVGALFVLTQEYLGLPGALGSATPGFLAQSERVDQGQYVFAPSITLKGGTRYWFYMYYAPGSAHFSPITGFSEDAYPGGDMYIAPELGTFSPLPFRKAQASMRVISFGPPVVYYTPPPGTFIDANFRLMGARAAQ